MRKLVFILFLPLAACLTAYRPPSDEIYSCNAYEEAANRLIEKEVDRSGDPDSFQLPLSISNQSFEYDFDNPPNAIIVRYSEGGRLVNRCDYSRALRAVQNGAIHQGNPKSQIIVVYVHGWRNDSGRNNERLYNYRKENYAPKTMGLDLNRFNTFLDELRKQQPDKAVLGVFVSWKGGTGVPLLEALSYTNRRNGADKLGNAGGLPRLMGAIKNISEAQEHESGGLLDNQIFYIGHSFGGRALYKSVVDGLILNTQLKHPTKGAEPEAKFDDVEGFADLIVLLNPAFEAASYQAVNEFRFARHRFSDTQLPLMITIQSESDRANGFYFPVGQLFSLEMNARERQAVGFRKQYHTHDLVLEESGECESQDDSASEPFQLYNDFCHAGISLKKRTLESGSDIEVESPYLMVRAEKNVLDGHGWYTGAGVDSFNNNDLFVNWLVRYLDLFEETVVLKNDSQISVRSSPTTN